MKSKMLPWIAIVLILETGLVHYFSAQHEFEAAAFLGYLFMANFLGALLAASRIAVWSREARFGPTFAPLSRDLERLRLLVSLQLGLLALMPLPAVLLARGFGA